MITSIPVPERRTAILPNGAKPTLHTYSRTATRTDANDGGVVYDFLFADNRSGVERVYGNAAGPVPLAN